MEWLHFREPVHAWTHALGLLLTIPACVLLWTRSRGDGWKRFAFAVFCLFMANCYLSSTLFHAVRLPPLQVEWFATMDYVGIYLMIAGSITPLALVVLQGPWRWGTLALAWGLAATGITLRLTLGDLPPLVLTALYAGMGWAVFACYFELARLLTHQGLRLALVGGLLYTVGAVFNVLHWPMIHPIWFTPHALFHLFVVAGSMAHVWFLAEVVAAYQPAPALAPAAPALRPALALQRRSAPVA